MFCTFMCTHECVVHVYTSMLILCRLQCQSSAGNRGLVAGVGGRVGKLSKSGISHGKDEEHVAYAGVNCVCNVCSSAHSCGYVVNSIFARTAF